MFITRSPCILASDARRIKVLKRKPKKMSKSDYKWLQNMYFGVVIFGKPVRGNRSPPTMIADGDL